MHNLRIRELEPKDDAGFRHVRAMVYRNGDPVKPEDAILPEDCIGYVGDLCGETVCAATAIDMTATKGGSALRCAGIAAVGVLPERRRSGIGAALMSELTPLLRDKGFAMASLYPFKASYYNRFGYAHCGKRYSISCPAERIPKVEPELEPVQLEGSDRKRVFGCYEQFASRYSGMNLRNESQWERILGRDNPFQVYAVGDPVQAYGVMRLNSDFWTNQSVKEFVWSSGEGYSSMIAFFRALGINKSRMEWNEPGDSPFLDFHLEQGVEFRLDRSIMFRIIDLRKAISSVQTTGRGEFCMKVEDPDNIENAGSWQVCYGPDGVRLERGGDPDFEIEIAPLTQAFLGEPSFQSVVNHGSCKVHRPEGLEAACRFFAPAHVHCMDFF